MLGDLWLCSSLSVHTPSHPPPPAAIASPSLDKTRAPEPHSSASTQTPPPLPKLPPPPLTAEQLKAIVSYKENMDMQQVLLGMGHDASSFYYYQNLARAFNELIELAATCPPPKMNENNLIPKLIDLLLADKGLEATRRPLSPPGSTSVEAPHKLIF